MMKRTTAFLAAIAFCFSANRFVGIYTDNSAAADWSLERQSGSDRAAEGEVPSAGPTENGESAAEPAGSEVSEANPGTPIDAKQVLDRLLARDQQFDNVHLIYTIEGEYEIVGHQMFAVQERREQFERMGREVLWAVPESGCVIFSYGRREQMIVRGPDITGIREPDPDFTPHAETQEARGPSFHKWHFVGGLVKELRSTMGASVLEFTEQPGEASAIEATSRDVRWALGFGYAKYFEAVSSAFQAGDVIILNGVCDLGVSSKYDARLELDENYVVRTGRLKIGDSGRHYTMTTSGTVEVDGFHFAEIGHYNHNGEKWDVEFQSARFGLSDHTGWETEQRSRTQQPDRSHAH